MNALMTEIRFYHLTTGTLEQALPRILTKAFESRRRTIVRTAGERESAHLNECLWTFRADSFLPHGCDGDGFEADQPVLLTHKPGNPNGAGLLILTAGAEPDDPAGFDLYCEIFDGNDEQARQTARAHWQEWGKAGHAVTYWRQNERGGWEKKQ